MMLHHHGHRGSDYITQMINNLLGCNFAPFNVFGFFFLIPCVIRALFAPRGRFVSRLSPDNCRRLANSGSHWQLREIDFLGYRGKRWD